MLVLFCLQQFLLAALYSFPLICSKCAFFLAFKGCSPGQDMPGLREHAQGFPLHLLHDLKACPVSHFSNCLLRVKNFIFHLSICAHKINPSFSPSWPFSSLSHLNLHFIIWISIFRRNDSLMLQFQGLNKVFALSPWWRRGTRFLALS